MSLKLKLRLKTPAPSPPAEPSRNSFTSTDYYRTTREEIYSPISRVESLSVRPPGSPYSDLPQSPTRSTRLAHIYEGSDEADTSDEGEEDEAAQQRVPKRTAALWHVFDALFRKWRRQKAEGNDIRSRPKAPPAHCL
ncbi:hypothetical protein B0H19DRAFT_467470 [Mycena capillaripes]|nr:hypothetical protein B0H19DRAFT_467470 [Mycena capillaripes]